MLKNLLILAIILVVAKLLGVSHIAVSVITAIWGVCVAIGTGIVGLLMVIA